MNDGHFIALRSYAEEQSSLLRQVLEEQKRTNELLAQLAEPVTQEQRAAILHDIDPGIKLDITPKAPAHTPGRIYTEVQKQTPKKAK